MDLLTLSKSRDGFTIIEVLITTFIIGTVVTGLFGLFVLSIRGSQESERRIVALALAQEKMELVRNLSYESVGTDGGIPSGSISQSETVDRNGLTYTVETDIRYVDDPYDGEVAGEAEDEDQVTICHKPGTPSEKTLTVGASALNAHLAHGDTSGACGSGGEGTPSGDEFNADYKQVRVSVRWPSPNNTPPVLLITYVTPDGIEGLETGGVLDFQAIDASGQSISQADVTIQNSTTNPIIDVSTTTNDEGRVVLPGFPESVESYELSVTKAGYTTEQTYDAGATFNPDSDHEHLTMIAQEVTSKTFQIDLVSSITLHTQDEDAGPLGSIAYNLRGLKTIGTDDNDDFVYEFNEDSTTNGSGDNTHSDLAWDQYELTIDGVATGYDIKETDPTLPLIIAPNEDLDVTVTLVDHTDYSLHVTVVNAAGEPVDNATARLFDGSFDETLGTGVLGQVLFADIAGAGEYTLEIDAPGFAATSLTITIDGTNRARIELGVE